MTQRIREKRTKTYRDSRDDRVRLTQKHGEYIDEFTTVAQEPYEVTLARRPKCYEEESCVKPSTRTRS